MQHKAVGMNDSILLFTAIILEVIATTALKFSQGFTKVIPTIFVVVGYVSATYLMSLCLRTIPIGVAYAIWSGVGIIFTVAIGVLIWREPLDLARIIGTLLIIAGILLINLFSKAGIH
jgi:small multidrug resistance pump